MQAHRGRSAPHSSPHPPSFLARTVGDGWQISGVSIFQSGAHAGFGFLEDQPFTGAPFNDMTGGPGGSRVNLVCDPNLPRGQRTAERQFRTECVQPPGPLGASGDIFYMGNALNDEWVNPGYMNHDISVFRNIAMGGSRRL